MCTYRTLANSWDQVRAMTEAIATEHAGIGRELTQAAGRMHSFSAKLKATRSEVGEILIRNWKPHDQRLANASLNAENPTAIGGWKAWPQTESHMMIGGFRLGHKLKAFRSEVSDGLGLNSYRDAGWVEGSQVFHTVWLGGCHTVREAYCTIGVVYS